MGAEFQAFLVHTLLAGGLCGGRVFDNVPKNPVFPYASLGPSQTFPRDSFGIPGREVHHQIDIWSRDGGSLLEARALSDTAVALIRRADLRAAGLLRLLDLRIEHVRVFQDPDGITAHAIAAVEAFLEEKI